MDVIGTLSNPAVIWVIIGVILLISELLAPGFIIFFFGIGALITSLATYLTDMDINMQFVIFVSSSLLSLFLLRGFLKNKLLQQENKQSNTIEDEYIGKQAIAETDISPNGIGKISFKGAPWNARSSYEIKKGQLVEIIEKDSITLIVKPINQ